MPENIFLKEIQAKKSGNVFLDELSGSSEWGSDGSSWDELNPPDSLERDIHAARAERLKGPKEDIFQRAERLRRDKIQQFKNAPVAATLNRLPVDPFSAAGMAYRDAKELFSDDPSSLPSGTIPSVVKGFADVPLRASQGFYNLAMPDSAESRAANEMVDNANQWYRGQGLDESAYGEAIGSSLGLAKLPTGGKWLEGSGRLARILKSMAVGGTTGSVASQVTAPKENIGSSKEFRDAALQDLIAGGVTGAGMPALQEGIGEGARRLKPFFKDFKSFLKEKIAQMSHEGTDQPSRALIEDIGNQQAVSLGAGRAKYDKAEREFGDLKTMAPQKISAYLDTEVLPKMKSQPVVDTPLVSALEELSSRLKPQRDPTTGRMMPPPASTTVSDLNNLVRSLRQKSQLATETAGSTVQRTRTKEEKDIYKAIDDIIESEIERKSPAAAAAYEKARQFWKEGDDVFAAPAAFTDEERAGRVVNTLRGSDKKDVAVSNLVRNKSADIAGSIADVTSKRGKAAIQVELLQQAQKANKKLHPEKFVESLTDKDGYLLPFVKEAFKGDDLKAIQGFIRLKKFSDLMGKATNIGGAAAFGTATGGAGLGVGLGAGAGAAQSTALWGRRGGWLPNFTAPMWEKLANNPATRSALAVMAKTPPTSPQFAKALAIVQQAAREDEE